MNTDWLLLRRKGLATNDTNCTNDLSATQKMGCHGLPQISTDEHGLVAAAQKGLATNDTNDTNCTNDLSATQKGLDTD